jgi:uncharacterized protein (TIGR03118 family)
MDLTLRFSVKICTLACLVFFLALSLLVFPVLAAGYVQSNLVSDGSVGSVPANFSDQYLVNPWGIAYSATSPFWVANNGTGVATQYRSDGTPQSLVVTISPPPGGPGPAKPTGQVFNGSADFNGNRFIFATGDGTIAAWASGTATTLQVDNSVSGAVYTGLALGNNGLGNFLYAANFHSGAIDVFDSAFGPVTVSGGFTDPNLPAGYAPFNVQNLGGKLFVTYAGQNGVGPGGLVDIFDANGNLQRRLVTQGSLNSPWGMALAPSQFGEFSNDLLLGNFGDGRINAFDPLLGTFLGTLMDSNGNPIVINGLRGLIFGNGGNGGDVNTLYFTAGQDHGLFGSLAPVPLPPTVLLLGSGLLGLVGWRRFRTG